MSQPNAGRATRITDEGQDAAELTAARIRAARGLPGHPAGDYLVPYRNVGQLLAMRASETPDKTFLIAYDAEGSRAEFSFREFERRVNQLANLMVGRLSVRRGQRVATLAHNDLLTCLIYFAAWKIGAAVAPQNTAEDDRRIAFVIDNAEARVLFCFPEYEARVQAIQPELPKVDAVVVLDEAFLAEVGEQPNSFEPVEPPYLEDECLLVYTSGTTGAPKGVVLSHYNLLVDALGISAWQGISGNQRMMCVLPIHHVNGTIVTLITPLFVGGGIVLNRAYSSSTFWQRIAAEKVHIVSVVPTLLQFSCEYGDQRAAAGLSIWGDGVTPADLAHFRHLICGAGTLAVSLAERFERQFGFPILHGYGLSETTCYSCFLPIDLSPEAHRAWMADHGYPSIGCPILPNEMAIFAADGSGHPLGPGERGEICIRGHNVTKGYYRRPDANAETFKFEWFRSGDEGFLQHDDRGRRFFFITGRIKELINRGGVKFSPFDIEEELLRVPGVSVGLAVAFENDYYGEEIGAYVVPAEGARLEAEAIIRHCRARLGFAKSPKVVLFGREAPVTSTGKYQRLALRDRFSDWKEVQFRENEA
ncbi:MAG: class I adenylate-forming enzyme family protein [Candidatus Promineifilaceae bacterium]